MSIPLTLGAPKPRDAHPLTARLLLPRCASAADAVELPTGDVVGPPVIAASQLTAAGGSGAIAYLDIDPGQLPADGAFVGAHIDSTADMLGDVLELPVPGRLTVFFDDSVSAENVRRVVAAGCSPGIEASREPDEIADLLAVVAHSDVGFVARAVTGAEVVAVLAATVAALRGDDIRTAFTNPDVAALARLNDEAAAAVRTVLLGVVVPAVAPIVEVLEQFVIAVG